MGEEPQVSNADFHVFRKTIKEKTPLKEEKGMAEDLIYQQPCYEIGLNQLERDEMTRLKELVKPHTKWARAWSFALTVLVGLLWIGGIVSSLYTYGIVLNNHEKVGQLQAQIDGLQNDLNFLQDMMSSTMGNFPAAAIN